MTILLELGSGDRPFEDGRKWIHTDARFDLVGNGIDHVMYAEKPDNKYIGKCDEVRATHLLEHFSHLETVEILSRWRALLKPGGSLYLEVPNFEAQCRALLAGRFPEAEVVVLAYGAQDYEGNYHKTGFTTETLANSLFSAGFEGVRIQDADMVLCAIAISPVVS